MLIQTLSISGIKPIWDVTFTAKVCEHISPRKLVQHTVIVLKESFWNAYESPLLVRDAIVVREDAIRRRRSHARLNNILVVSVGRNQTLYRTYE